MLQFKLGNFLKSGGGKCTNQQYLLKVSMPKTSSLLFECY